MCTISHKIMCHQECQVRSPLNLLRHKSSSCALNFIIITSMNIQEKQEFDWLQQFTVIKDYMKISHVDMTNTCIFLGHHKLMNYSLNFRCGQLNCSMLQAYSAQKNCNMKDE